LRPALIVSFVSLAAFAALAARVSDGTPWLDRRILRLVPPSNESTSFSRLCNDLVAAVIVLAAIVVTAALVGLIAQRRWRAALFWFLTFGGVIALDVILKPLFERPAISGPSDEFSFPSGNAMASMALLLGALTLVSGRNTRRILLVAGAGVVIIYGTALVYLSWHYPSDVLAGWLLALAWVSLLAFATRPPIVFAFNRSRAMEHTRSAARFGSSRVEG
jgi:membrane-associated phospholipid phosphatase